MQTFLPYADFEHSAACLDDARLKNQRNECKALLKTIHEWSVPGWRNHPCAKQWWDYPEVLAIYALHICGECRVRGFAPYQYDDMEDAEWFSCFMAFGVSYELPWWIGYEPYHESHRSNLLRKDPGHYRLYWPNLAHTNAYIWPSKVREVASA